MHTAQHSHRMQWLALRQSPRPGPKPPAAAGLSAQAFAEKAVEHLRLSALDCNDGRRKAGRGKTYVKDSYFFFHPVVDPCS